MNRSISLFGGLLAGMPLLASAQLQAISDEAMSEVTGQAFVSIDRQYHPDAQQNVAYTRVNLGLDLDVQLEADVLELGRYERNGEAAGTSDVLINDFALGYINNQAYFDRNPDAPRQRKADGSAYGEGEIVPFSISNPFFEFAFDEGTDEVVGVRLGFGEAQGILSGNIQNLTGDVNVNIQATGADLDDADSNGNWVDQVIKLLGPIILRQNALRSKAKLVYGQGHPQMGELDPVRATHAGVPNGERFIVEDVPFWIRLALGAIGGGASSEIEIIGDQVHIIASDCKVIGIEACFPLTNFESLAIGQIDEVNGERRVVAPESGLFLSFQTQQLEWLKDVSKSNPTVDDFIRTGTGGFFNIPSGAVEFSLGEALGGIDRYRTEYIDRGRGLF